MKTKTLLFSSIAFCVLLFNATLLQAQWQKTNFPVTNCPYNYNFISCIVATESNLFVGMVNCHGVYSSTNNGDSWVISTEIPEPVSALAYSGPNIFAGSDGSGVYMSSNNGVSWDSTANNGLTYPYIYSIMANGSNLYAGTSAGSHGGGVFVSTDNGANWDEGNGLSFTGYSSIVTDGTNIFAGTDCDSVFLSTNNGLNWTSVSSGLPTGNYVRSLLIDGTNIFAGLNRGGGIYLSSNNGASWNSVNNGLLNLWVGSIVKSGTNLFAGTFAGVFVSSNSGLSWSSINSGITDTVITDLAINSTYIFAGTYDLASNVGSIWKRPLSDFAGVDNQSINNAITVYPNPVFNEFTIEMGNNTNVTTFEIINSLGQVLFKGNLTKKTTVQTSTFPPGVYLIKLENGQFLEFKKIIKE